MLKFGASVVAFSLAAFPMTGTVAWADGCSADNLAPFSRLGKVVAEARAEEPGKLLATWLLRPREAGKCNYVFRIDLLLESGQIRSINFDARTLERVEIEDERGWVDASVRDGSGGAQGGSEILGVD